MLLAAPPAGWRPIEQASLTVSRSRYHDFFVASSWVPAFMSRFTDRASHGVAVELSLWRRPFAVVAPTKSIGTPVDAVPGIVTFLVASVGVSAVPVSVQSPAPPSTIHAVPSHL